MKSKLLCICMIVYTHPSVFCRTLLGTPQWLLQPQLVLPKAVSCQDFRSNPQCQCLESPMCSSGSSPCTPAQCRFHFCRAHSHIQVLVEPTTFLFFISVAVFFPGLPSHDLSTHSSCGQRATPRFVAHHSLDPSGQCSDILLGGTRETWAGFSEPGAGHSASLPAPTLGLPALPLSSPHSQPSLWSA